MRRLSSGEVEAVRAALGHPFPGLYCKLLVDLGYGRQGDIEIYDPDRIRDLYEAFFDDPAQLFSVYFPIGCNNRTQELWVIDPRTETVASIWHETVPDDWSDESWHSYDEWIVQVLEPAMGNAQDKA